MHTLHRSKPVRFESLVEVYLQDLELNRRASIERARISCKFLSTFFAKADAREISTDKIRVYIQYRQAQKTRLGTPPSPATINRELSALKRMLRIAAQSSQQKISSVPHIPMLREDNVRTGFFEWQEVQRLIEHLPSYWRPVVLCAFFTGMRRGEILQLKWKHIDLKEGMIRLDPEMTKTREGRVIYLPELLMKEFRRLRWEGKRKYPETQWVFTRHGQQLKHIQRGWKTACLKAGLEGRRFHDLRRSAVRNLVRSGVPERVAMAISGHKTRSVFDRYNIVDERDLKTAAGAIETLLNGISDG